MACNDDLIHRIDSWIDNLTHNEDQLLTQDERDYMMRTAAEDYSIPIEHTEDAPVTGGVAA